MDFLESILESKFKKYHKKNNIDIDGLRKLRSETNRLTQKKQRVKNMDEARNLKDAITPSISRVKASSSTKKQASPHLDRLTKLKIWKKERETKMQQKNVSKPTFKIGAPKNVGFPTLKFETMSFAPKNHVFKPPSNLKGPGLKKEESKILLRVTRSQKPVASPPVPLPSRTRKKITPDGKENKEDVGKKSKKDSSNKMKVEGGKKNKEDSGKKKKTLQRQNAVDGTPGQRKSCRKSLSQSFTVTDVSTKEEKQPVSRTPIDKRTTVLTNITPDNTYVSPYVTVSRGKGSVRKENLNRSIRGLLSYTDASSTESGVAYFYTILNNEISRLQELCHTWSGYKEAAGEELTEDAKDMIDVAVGQAQLLMSKKFKQFEGLIKSCQTGVGQEKEVTCEDLQGFWDMVFMQVENLNTRFGRLSALKENNWEEIVDKEEPKVVKKRPVSVAVAKTTKSTASSGIRAAILAARKKKLESAEPEPEIKEESVFNGGFFQVRTPHKNTSNKNTPNKHTPNKHTPKPTPRSILKSNKKKSVANLNKSVLFKGEDSESEDSPLNTTFEKSPPRKEKTQRKRKSRSKK